MNIIESLRQFRIGEYAIFDITISFLGMYLLSPLLSKLFLKLGIDIPKRNRVFLTLPIGILIHFLIGKITPMTRDFLDVHGHYILKTIILASLILGTIGVRIVRK